MRDGVATESQHTRHGGRMYASLGVGGLRWKEEARKEGRGKGCDWVSAHSTWGRRGLLLPRRSAGAAGLLELGLI